MSERRMTGRIHSYETFGAADGPGVRFIVFLHGCGFRCRYCHNPDTWATPACDESTADQVLARALRYKGYWREKGGITVSGGEPMLQAEFVCELFEKAKAQGITTCLDTAAGPFDANDAVLRRLLDLTDTVLLDIKHIDPAAHRELTGADNDSVLACARYLSSIGKPVWIRHVLVPGLTDDLEAAKRLRAFLDTLTNVERVDVLPYHVLGLHKWRELGIPYTLEGVEPPTDESIRQIREILCA